MAHIIPIRDLKNTSEISEKCRAANEPIFVTKNGYGDTKDGAFVQVGTYWYEVQELTKSIEAIKEAIEEAENEEA